jgi:hypothetical protein
MPKGKTIGGNTTKDKSAITDVKKGKPGQTATENAVTNTAAATTTGNAISGTGGFTEGGWKSGEKQGKWEQGATGQWQSGDAVGPWESGDKVGKWEAGATGKWKQGATGQWAGGGGGGGIGKTGSAAAANDQAQVDRVRKDSGFSGMHGGYATESGGAAGGGGTGSPYAPGLSETVRNLGLKSSSLEGKSVEETISRGARKTKKTGQKRSL